MLNKGSEKFKICVMAFITDIFVVLDGCLWSSEINFSVQGMFLLFEGVDEDGAAAVVVRSGVELQRVDVL